MEGEKNLLSTHIIVRDEIERKEIIIIKQNVRELMNKKGIEHVMIEVDFESANVDYGVISIFCVFQKISMKEIESHFLAGANEMMSPIIVLILSWGLSSIVEDLGFVKFVTNIVEPNIPTFLIPAVIFLIGCVASYFMGSAWGTWTLIMPIAIPLAVTTKIQVQPLMK